MIPYFQKSKQPADNEIVVIRYIKPDRSPLCCYNVGDIAGWPRRVATRLIEQRFAELYDAGAGPGKPVETSVHLPEPWEENGDWVAFNRPLSQRLIELAEAKLKLGAERAAINVQIAQREERRERLLADDRSEKEILGLDSEFDALHVKLEKIDAQVRFIEAEILRASEAQIIEKWRVVNEKRLAAAREYAEALSKVQQAYIEFCRAREPTLSPEFRAPFIPPLAMCRPSRRSIRRSFSASKSRRSKTSSARATRRHNRDLKSRIWARSNERQSMCLNCDKPKTLRVLPGSPTATPGAQRGKALNLCFKNQDLPPHARH